MKIKFLIKYLLYTSCVLVLIDKATAENTQTVKPFTHETWESVLKNGKRPSVWVFTASDCTHCPAVIKQLIEYRKHKKLSFALMVVQTNEGDVKKPVKLKSNIKVGDHLYQFSGQKQRIQYSINPQWRGIVPYVVMLPNQGGIQYTMGLPNNTDLIYLQ